MTIERLSPEDVMMLWPDEVWPQDIGVVGVLDGAPLFEGDQFAIDRVRAALSGRLNYVPRFRQLLHVPPRPQLGGPLWMDDPHFSIAHHVKVAPLPEPADEFDLHGAVERVMGTRLDRGRPLWELWLLPGLAQQQVGMFARMHHTIGDGIAGVATLATLLDTEAETASQPIDSWAPTRAPSDSELLADVGEQRRSRQARRLSWLSHPVRSLDRVISALPAMYELFGEGSIAPTSLTRLVGQGRRVAVVRTNLAEVRALAHEHRAKVNDVLVSVIAGGLRRLFAARQEAIPPKVRVYVPVSLRQGRYANARGNLIAQMMLPLPTAVADPYSRLELIARETARRKSMVRPSLGVIPTNGIASRMALKLIDRQHVNVATADLPGPPVPMYLAGARLLEITPVIPLIGKVSLGVGALSYGGQLNIGVVADRDAFPDLHVFVNGMSEELRALQLTAGCAEAA